MNQGINKEDIKTLLEPVELGSFALSSQTRSRETYSGFPEIKNSKMWDFSLTENGDGNRILSFLVNNRTLNFELEQSQEKDKPITAKRLPDTEVDDFGVGGNAYVGRAQIHKSNNNNLLGTFQTGKVNMTFQLEKDPENPKKWSIIPRKDPKATVQSFVKNITERYKPKKTAEEKQADNIVNKLTNPLTGGMGGALTAAGIGFGLGGLKGLYDKWKDGDQNNLSVLQKALIGAGIGGLGSAGIQYFGDPKYMSKLERERHLNNMDPNKSFIFSKEFYSQPSYLDIMEANSKSAFEGFRAELQSPNNFEGFRAELKTTPSSLGTPHKAPNRPSVPQTTIKETPRIVAAREAVQRASMEREENARRLQALNSSKPHSELQSTAVQHLEVRKGKSPSTANLEYKQTKPNLGQIKESSDKLAFSSGNQTVDLIALQSILGADPTLTQGDRNVLMGQARAALRQTPGSSINVNQLRGMGLGMLIGYATSKLLGFGPFGTVASIAVGGALGGSGRKSGPSWQSGGYYVY